MKAKEPQDKLTEYDVTVPAISFCSIELDAESEEQAIVILNLALRHHDFKIENLVKEEPEKFRSEFSKTFVTPKTKDFGLRTVREL